MTHTHTDDGLDPHADKYNDPRVKITRRGIGLGIAVFVIASITAGLSIYARKTPLVETTKFWGPNTITALQLGERIELLARGDDDFPRVELTTTPGLGHLRRALLDERNFDWDSVESKPALFDSTDPDVPNDNEAPASIPSSVQLKITDPTAHRFDVIQIDIDLAGGWVGPSDGSQRVRVNDYVRPKLRNYFKTVVNFKQRRYDDRD